MINWNSIANMTCNHILCIYIFFKSINNVSTSKQKILSFLLCLFGSFLSITYSYYISELMIRIITCIVFIIFIWLILRIRIDIVISSYLFSYGISYCIIVLTASIIGLVLAPHMSTKYTAFSNISFSEPIYLFLYILIATLQFILAYLFFNIKRFKNGFPFLFKKNTIIASLIVAGSIILFITSMIDNKDVLQDYYAFTLFIIGFITVGVGIIIWLKRGIKVFYKNNMKERAIESLEQELLDNKLIYKQLLEQNNALRAESHSILNRLSALEHAVFSMSQKSHSTELSEELSITLEDIKRLSNEYRNGIDKIKGEKPLLSTKVKMIDDIFQYFSCQCESSNIEFNLNITGSIPYMIEHIIPQNKLETMICDHLKDSIIAINSSSKSYKSVFVLLGLAENFYELSIYDSGMPFEINTLAKLGTERTTTHADSGGNGIGFMTTFETMRECGASLIINEKQPRDSDYTKSVTIRFDGKNQYIVETYRPDAFPYYNDRYIVKNNQLLNI